jgi:hypothetical protein
MEAPATRGSHFVSCQLVDGAGRLVSAGLCEMPATDREGTLVRVSALDRPGTFVQRCVLGSLTHFELHLHDGRRFAARLVEAGFTVQEGRTCLLALTPLERPAQPPRAPRNRPATGSPTAPSSASWPAVISSEAF